MSNNIFLVDESDIKNAQEVCSVIEEVPARNSAVANCLAAEIASRYFESIGINSDSKSGLHNIPEVRSLYDISDIYVNGNYIDIRLYFDSNGICIPYSHIKNDIKPALYMFIKVNEDLSSAEVSGFISHDSVDKTAKYGDYIKINEEDLISFEKAEAYFSEHTEDDITPEFEKAVFNFPEESDSGLLGALLNSKKARTFFNNAMFAKRTVNALNFDSSSDTDEPVDIQTSDEYSDEFNTQNDDIELNLLPDDGISENEIFSEMNELSDELQLSDDDDISVTDLSEYNEDSTLPDADDVLNTEDIFMEDTAEVTDNVIQLDYENDEISLEQNSTSDEISFISPDNYVAEESVTGEDDNNSDDNSIPFEESVESLTDESATPTEEYIDNNDLSIDYSEKQDEFDELSKYDYTTEITQNIDFDDDIEQESDENESAVDIPGDDTAADDENSNPAYDGEDAAPDETTIDELFAEDGEEPPAEQIQEEIKPKKKTNPVIPILGLVVILGAAGYFGYTKYQENSVSSDTTAVPVSAPVKNPVKESDKNDAMPNETVENVKQPENNNEGTSVSIPEIEQNLGGSVDISALSVSWEVPSAFVSNPTAKRYFVKLGKVMQLNLKTELLLQSTPPISNKIMLELEYNNSSNVFEVKNMLKSSGTPKIDEVIKNTVQNILKMNLNTNMSVFGSLKGNPILIIKL